MAAHKDSFDDRRKAAEAAKRAIAEKFRAQPRPDDPAVQERQAALMAVAKAREERQAARKAERAAEAARLAAEKKAQEAEAARLAAEKVAAERALELERKAARDARYAARKARR